jgi:hypothetical protein
MALAHANTALAIIAAWDAAPDGNAKMALEQNALAHGTTAVRVEALLNRDARQQANMATLWQAALNPATAAVAQLLQTLMRLLLRLLLHRPMLTC